MQEPSLTIRDPGHADPPCNVCLVSLRNVGRLEGVAIIGRELEEDGSTAPWLIQESRIVINLAARCTRTIIQRGSVDDYGRAKRSLISLLEQGRLVIEAFNRTTLRPGCLAKSRDAMFGTKCPSSCTTYGRNRVQGIGGSTQRLSGILIPSTDANRFNENCVKEEYGTPKSQRCPRRNRVDLKAAQRAKMPSRGLTSSKVINIAPTSLSSTRCTATIQVLVPDSSLIRL